MPPSLFPGADGLGLRRWTIAAVGCLFAVWAGFTLAEQPYLVFAGLAGLLYVGTLAVNARPLAWLIIALQPAALIVPFFPGRPFWWELCALLAWPSLLAYFLVNRQKLEALKFDRLEKWALMALGGYVGVIVILMLYRGVGFRAFGGGQMGGRFYTQQMVLTILPLLMISTLLSRKQLVVAVCVGWGLAFTYLISDFSFSLTGSLQKVLYFFELPTDAVNFELGFEATGLRRYQSFGIVGAALFSATLIWVSLRDLLSHRALLGLPILFGAILLSLSSGHRAAFIQIMVTLAFLTFFQRFWTPLRAVFAVVFATAAIASLYFVAADLPLSVQRSISFLPGIEVAALARDNALDTLNDRIEVLKLAINDIPRYLLIGRGFGMARFDILPSDEVYAGVWLQYMNGAFYNGLLGSLLKTGIAGFLCTGSFVFWVSRMAVQVIRAVWRKKPNDWSVFDRLVLLTCAQWFSLVFFFYCLHGDVGVWAQVFALPASVIMLCRRLLMASQEQAGSEDGRHLTGKEQVDSENSDAGPETG
jgi:hypothetical protein